MSNLRAVVFVLSIFVLATPVNAETALVPDRSYLNARPGQAVAGQKALVDLRDQNNNGLADGLETQLTGKLAGEAVQVIVTLTRPAPKAEFENAIGAFKLDHEFSLINGFSGTVNAGQAGALAKLPFVFRVEPVYSVSLMMEGSKTEMGVNDVRSAYSGPSLPGTGRGIGICFVDSGIESAHEVFNKGGVSKIVNSCNAIGAISRVETCDPTNPSVADEAGHGTGVAGVAAGDGEGSSYAQVLQGIAPEASVYVVKILGENGIGNDGDAEAGVEWCAQQAGVHVINLSIQGSLTQSDGLDSMSQIVNAAVQSGKVVVTGAGNRDEPHSMRPPATSHLAIAVGATGEAARSPNYIFEAGQISQIEADMARQAESHGPFIAHFSSRGFTSDGRLKPDIVAPGHSIATAASNRFPTLWTCGNSCYNIVDGTSFSTPMVSGIVALMLEANANLNPDDVRDILFLTARDSGYLGDEPDNLGQPIKDSNYGYGHVDAYAAVREARVRLGDNSMSSDPTPMPSKYISARQAIVYQVPWSAPVFTVTQEDADSGVALVVSMTAPLSGFLDGFLCFPPFNFCEYRPDIDITLQKITGQPLSWASNCMLGNGNGQVACGPAGLMETITVPNPPPGDYQVTLHFVGNEAPGTTARAMYEISWGSMTTVPRPGVQNTAPIADAGPDQNTSDNLVTLDGSNSSDPDGSINFYTWYWDGGNANGPNPTVILPLGTTTMKLTVVDNLDKTHSDEVVVTVTDGTGNTVPTVSIMEPGDSVGLAPGSRRVLGE